MKRFWVVLRHPIVTILVIDFFLRELITIKVLLVDSELEAALTLDFAVNVAVVLGPALDVCKENIEPFGVERVEVLRGQVLFFAL